MRWMLKEEEKMEGRESGLWLCWMGWGGCLDFALFSFTFAPFSLPSWHLLSCLDVGSRKALLRLYYAFVNGLLCTTGWKRQR